MRVCTGHQQPLPKEVEPPWALNSRHDERLIHVPKSFMRYLERIPREHAVGMHFRCHEGSSVA